MSRETLLDDAIAKAKADEDWQLVEWLRMARGGESAARWYTAKLGEARLDMSKLMTENAKLREQMERLVTLLRADCDIEASWDGLRKFWSIGLTEDGCLMRDRACKAEAENAELRHDLEEANNQAEEVCIENAKLRELVSGLEHCSQGFDCDCCPLYDPSNTNHHGCESLERELGIEVDDA